MHELHLTNDNSVLIQIWSLCSTRYKIMPSFGSFKVLLINTTVKFTALHTHFKRSTWRMKNSLALCFANRSKYVSCLLTPVDSAIQVKVMAKCLQLNILKNFYIIFTLTFFDKKKKKLKTPVILNASCSCNKTKKHTS